MKKLILSTAALAFTASFAMAQDVVRMGTEGAYPPWNFLNDNGEVDGFERDLGDELCKRAELNCEWVTNDWDSIIPNLVSGNYDVIAAQTGTIQAGYIADSGATLVEFASPEETLAAVRNGEADAVLADKSFLAPFVDEDPDLVFTGPDVPLGDGVGMGLRESDNELRETFDAAIQSMKDDGSLNELIT